MSGLTKADFRAAALAKYANPSDDDIEVDDNAVVSRSDDGAFVAAWVWVRNEEAKSS